MKQQLRTLFGTALVVMCVLLMASSGFARYYPGQDQPQPRIIPGKVTVQLEDDVNIDNAAKAFGRVSFGLPSLDGLMAEFEVNEYQRLFPWRTTRPKVNSGMHDMTRFVELTFPESYDVMEVVRELSQNPNVRAADPVWEIPLDAAPDDPQWPNQWAMEPGPPDPYFYDAWDIETGSDSIIFALIDSGIDYDHPDLEGNIWINPGEDLDGDGVVYDIDDLNGVDDDGNGIVDDIIGYDFFSGGTVYPGEDGDGPDTDPDDFNGHGTHVAGIAAAMTNNANQVTGAAGGWYGGHRSYRGARIICCRVGYTGTDGNGYVNSNNCAQAIDYSAMMGANVMNASWGGAPVNAFAAANAMAAGVTFCHAAGNDSADNPDEMDNQPGMLSVASVGPSSDTRSSFSNFGYWVDVCAPGSNILSTYPGGATATLGGTSMASPMVAGLALLIRSAMPSLTKTQVDSIIVNTTDPVEYANSELYWYKLGSGRINAFSALAGLPSAQFTSDVTDGNVPLTVNFTDLSPYTPTSWDWSFGDGAVSYDQNPQHTYTTPGVYDVSLLVDDTSSLGLGEEHLKRYVWAQADSLLMDSVEVQVGQKITVPIYLANTAQAREIIFSFQLVGHGGTVKLDTFMIDGLRTDYFEILQKIGSDINNQRFSLRLSSNGTVGSNYLQPGNGAILNLVIDIPTNVTPGQVITIDTTTVGGHNPKIYTPLGEYWPLFQPGKIVIQVCDHGDANCDGQINVSDLTMIVAYLFQAGPEPDLRGGDVNADGSIIVSDITYLVDYLFAGGPPPPD